MKVVGIIAEYNPFHFGHDYQIRKARELFGEDAAIVAVMSGDFVQRGEPAIAGKWPRTQAALACGVDLVMEIPFTFACSSAERFAHGAVALLNASGVVTDLFFGSECDDFALLDTIAELLREESPLFISLLKSNLKEGKSYAKARELALVTCLADSGKTDLASKVSEVLNMPNAILAVEYLIALKKTGSPIKPSLLLRSGAGFLDTCISGKNASATAIRNTVTENSKSGLCSVSSLAEKLAGKMPSESLAPLLTEWSNGIRPVLAADFLPETVVYLRAHTAKQLEGLAYMGDQVSRRLKNAVSDLRSCTREALPESFRNLADTKRYAGTRLNRAMVSLLCGQTSSDLTELASPEYLRILGFSDRGRYLLRLMRKFASLPLIDKASDFLEYGSNRNLVRMAELDLISTDLWGLKAGYIYGYEYERTVIRMKGYRGSDK